MKLKNIIANICVNSVLASAIMVCGNCVLYSDNCCAEKVTVSDGFTYEEISEDLKENMNNNSFKMYSSDGQQNDWVRFSDLRYLKVKHWGFDDKIHDGELVVHESIAKEVLEIFKELFDSKFYIEKIELIDNYDSDDNKSMRANNTSCLRMSEDSFNRKKPWHALGLAIDINPKNNPCSYPNSEQNEPKFVPDNADKYLDRTLSDKGMIKQGDACYNAFVKRGWEWGGSWDDPIDLHHFQKYTWTTEFPRKYKK